MSVTAREPIVLAPNEGRSFPMGRLSAVFKAGGAETAGAFCISEWWLEPHTKGTNGHAHPEDDMFYVLEGTVSFLIGNRWVEAPKGSFVLAPGGTTHDFENRSSSRAGFLNIHCSGTFEQERMPGIAEWFRENRSNGTGT